ncbi:MAG: dihydroorotase [Saprospiraceae bacterium]
MILIKNARLVNENKIIDTDILIENDRIKRIDKDISDKTSQVIDAKGNFVIPGIIDDQVHFREPGMEYKANIYSESRAGILGGVTSFMDMPNNNPPILSQELLQSKYDIADKNSYANYSFYIGAGNDNYEEVMKTNPQNVCGIKIFMGSSTGNMLVDDDMVLDKLFSNVELLIATHCEDENTVKNNLNKYIEKYHDKLDANSHPLIRSREACLLSSSKAVSMAKKHNTRLHILHLTTADEMTLFNSDIPLKDKKITAEVCVHHLLFNDSYYQSLGNKVKCNPAIKTENDRLALWKALREGKLDVVATDHAPHTMEEKNKAYIESPSGLPLVQHSLNIMLDFYEKGEITMEFLVEKMCHNPAIAFNIKERGFIREGYYADLVILSQNNKWTVSKDNIAYKCEWSPLEGKEFNYKINNVLVNGTIAVTDGKLTNNTNAMRLEFDRK